MIALISIGLAVALLFGLLIMWKKFSGPNMRQLYDALYDTNKYAKTEKKDEKPAKKEVKKKFLKKTKPDGTIETTLIEKRYGKR